MSHKVMGKNVTPGDEYKCHTMGSVLMSHKGQVQMSQGVGINVTQGVGTNVTQGDEYKCHTRR